MSDLTYQRENTDLSLETYEWDNIWWEHTENTTSKRVLYIGDSISCGTRHIATRISNNTVLFDGFGTSKALDNPYFKEALAVYIKQELKVRAILFNNGLHGWHLSDDAYKREYRSMITFIKALSDAPIFIVLTTAIGCEDERNKTIINRNEIAKDIAAEFGLKSIDLHSVSVQNSNLYKDDCVHFTDDGYGKLAECILDTLNKNGI